MPLKRDEAFWKEGMDEKRFALCCIHKIWICLAAALAGAVFAAGIYLGVRQLTMGPKQYRSEVLYSIVYDIDEDDEVLKEFINEYNAYTWGDMMRSDRVMDTVLLQLPDVERSVIEASISTEIASDPEFLTAYFTTGDAALSDRIAAAYNCAMTAFGQTMQGRGLTAIEVWKTVSAQAVLPENKVKMRWRSVWCSDCLLESWVWQSGMFWTIPFCSAQTWKNAAQFRFWATEQQSQMNSSVRFWMRSCEPKRLRVLFRKFRWTRCFPGRWDLGKKKRFRLSFGSLEHTLY